MDANPAAPAAIPAESRPPTQLSRDQILDATAACLAELGYDATTIRVIARRLNCAVGSIYRYFTDNRQLLAAVTQRAFLPVLHGTERGEPVMDTVRLYARIATGDELAYRLMFFLASVGPETRDDSIAAGADRRGGRMPAVVIRIIDQWARQLGDVAQARRVWSMVHGSVTIGQDIEAMIDDVCSWLDDAGPRTHQPRATDTGELAAVTVDTAVPTAAPADDVCLL
jgi:AcrR family transcriptional regulator